MLSAVGPGAEPHWHDDTGNFSRPMDLDGKKDDLDKKAVLGENCVLVDFIPP